jgi:putative flippase GtrA
MFRMRQEGRALRAAAALRQVSRGSLAVLVAQLWKFGLVGLAALLVDVGGFNLLRFAGGQGPLYDWPLMAKVLSACAATLVSWAGNRTWTFRGGHGRRRAHHELALFFVACAAGTLVALGCLALSHYVLGYTSPLADNVSANVVGLVLGTACRFWLYRTWVFKDDVRTADGPGATVVSGGADGPEVVSTGPARPSPPRA